MQLKGGDFYGLIGEAARRTGLAWWLIYGVIEQESGFDPKAESECGALGLMQLMPSSFAGVARDQLLEPAINLGLGAGHLRECVAMWKQESPDEALKFGLASYNGGPGYVLAAQRLAMEEGGDAHSWAGIEPRLAAGEWDGKRCDAGQIIGYVQSIWTRFERRRAMPAPVSEAA